jgi:hypothetical protein
LNDNSTTAPETAPGQPVVFDMRTGFEVLDTVRKVQRYGGRIGQRGKSVPRWSSGVGGVAASGLDPFQIYPASQLAGSGIDDTTGASWWRTFVVHTGTVWPPYHLPIISNNDDVGDGTPSNLFVVPASSTAEFYLKMTLGGANFFSTITIISDGSTFGLQGNVGSLGVRADTQYWYFLIGYVTVGADPTPAGSTPPWPAGVVENYNQIVTENITLDAPCFPVYVTQSGGTAGSSTDYCSFTYTIQDLTGVNIAPAPLSPLLSPARIIKCTCTAGTNGMAFYDNVGQLNLATVNELATQVNC